MAAAAQSFSAIGEWVAEAPSQVLASLRIGRDPLTADGRRARDTRHASGGGQAGHLLAAADEPACAVLALACVDGKINEISCFAPLLEPLELAGAVITSDALRT